MSNVVVLNSKAHLNMRVLATPSAEHGDGRRFVPVIAGEIPHLAAHYPVFLSKDSETGAFYCGAMLGFDEDENLFLGAEAAGVYRPLDLQRGPFYTAGPDLAVDLDHPRVGAAEGEALFTQEGAPTPYLESIMALMRDLRPGGEVTRVFVETLLKLKLIEPVELDVGFDDGVTRSCVGLYTIDQTALRALPDATVVELFRRGYLQLIYLMIASLKQVPALARRKNDRLLGASDALAGLGG